MISGAQCTGWLYLFVTFTACSIFMVCVISVDRYLGVVEPIRHSLLAASHGSRRVTLTVWMVAILIALPVLLPLLDDDDRTPDFSILQCHMHQPLWYIILCDIIVFLLPLCVMEECYRRVYREVSVRSKLINAGTVGVSYNDAVLEPSCGSQQGLLRIHRGGQTSNVSIHRPQSHSGFTSRPSSPPRAHVACRPPTGSVSSVRGDPADHADSPPGR